MQNGRSVRKSIGAKTVKQGGIFVVIVAILIVLASYLMGSGAFGILYRGQTRRELSWADAILVGAMMIIGLAEVAHMGAVVLGLSLSQCEKLFVIGLAVFLVGAVVLLVPGWRNRQRGYSFGRKPIRIFFCIFCLMVLIQLFVLVTEMRVYPTGDMTAETVNSFLATDGIYQVNPMTGQAYTAGIPLRIKILCLPTFYAIICDVFGLSTAQVVWTIVPALTLLGSYLAFHTVARALFPDEEKKRDIFMIIVALLLWVGDYLYGMDGFAVQYAGFRGVSIRLGILLPYTFGLLLRKKWRLVLLCVLAEACIVWTLYGMGACLLVAVGMAVTSLAQNQLEKRGTVSLRGDKEGTV